MPDRLSCLTDLYFILLFFSSFSESKPGVYDAGSCRQADRQVHTCALTHVCACTYTHSNLCYHQRTLKVHLLVLSLPSSMVALEETERGWKFTMHLTSSLGIHQVSCLTQPHISSQHSHVRTGVQSSSCQDSVLVVPSEGSRQEVTWNGVFLFSAETLGGKWQGPDLWLFITYSTASRTCLSFPGSWFVKPAPTGSETHPGS